MSKINSDNNFSQYRNILSPSPSNITKDLRTIEINKYNYFSSDRLKINLIQKSPININNLLTRKAEKSFDDYKTFTQKDFKKGLYGFKSIKVKKNQEYNILTITEIYKNKNEKNRDSFLYKNDFSKTSNNVKSADEKKDNNENYNSNINIEEKKSNEIKSTLCAIKKKNNVGEINKSTIDKLKQKLKSLMNKSMKYKKNIKEKKLINNEIENKLKVIKNNKKRIKKEETNFIKLNKKIETCEKKLSSKIKILNELENNKNTIMDNLSQIKTEDTSEDCNYDELLNEIKTKNNEIEKKINISKKKLNKITRKESILKIKYENKISNIKKQIIELSHDINIIDKNTNQEEINKYYKQYNILLSENQSLKNQLLNSKELNGKIENLKKLNENYFQKINKLKNINFQNINLSRNNITNTITDDSRDLSNYMSNNYNKYTNDNNDDASIDYNNIKSETQKIKKRRKKRKKSYEYSKSNNSFDNPKHYSIKKKRKKNNSLNKKKTGSFLFSINNKGVFISFDTENKKYSILQPENINGWEIFIKEYLDYYEGSLCLNTCDGLLIVTGKNYNNLYLYSQKKENISKIRTFEYSYKYGGIIITTENNLVILGGCDNTNVELFNIEENKKIFLSCLITERINSSYSYIGNILFALFGKENQTIEYLDLNNKNSNWKLLDYTTNLENNMKINLDGHVSIPINNNEIIIVGGSKNDKILVFNFEAKFVEKTNVNIPLIESAGEYRFDKDKYFNLFENNNNEKDDNVGNLSQLMGIDSKGNIHTFNSNFSYIVILIKDINK